MYDTHLEVLKKFFEDHKCSINTYDLNKTIEIVPASTLHYLVDGKASGAPITRFRMNAGPAGKIKSVEQRIQSELCDTKANTVLVDLAVQKQKNRGENIHNCSIFVTVVLTNLIVFVGLFMSGYVLCFVHQSSCQY